MSTMSLGIVYEHPEWFQLLFNELERRSISFEKIRADLLTLDPDMAVPPLVLNRMSPSSWRRGSGQGLFATRDLLFWLESKGVAVVNGSEAYATEISKARQIALFRKAGVNYPRARVINHPSLAFSAAAGLRYPVVVKPNIGGSGAGITRFDTPEQLQQAQESGQLDLGVDQVALVQEFCPAREGFIVRVEVLDNKFLYAIRIWPNLSSFNLCPADICQTAPEPSGACVVEAGKLNLRVEGYQPPPEAIEGALKLARLAKLDIGGIEYLVDDRDGSIKYYDVNALSNFVADAENVIGFNPTSRFVDYLEKRLAAVSELSKA